MILYLAGKMTGLPDYGRKQFNEAEKRLTAKGHIVINPARLPIGLDPSDYMRIGLTMLDAADAIYILPGWEDSRGTRMERHYARYQGKRVLYEVQRNETGQNK